MGVLGAGGVTNAHASGWRDIFWMQAAFHLASALGLLCFYHPAPRPARSRLSLKALVWACDPVGSALFVASAALLLLALDWAGGSFPWSDAHVAAPLSVGCVLLVAFGLYGAVYRGGLGNTWADGFDAEWKGRADGLVAHVFFKGSPNFALSVFAFAVEGHVDFDLGIFKSDRFASRTDSSSTPP